MKTLLTRFLHFHDAGQSAQANSLFEPELQARAEALAATAGGVLKEILARVEAGDATEPLAVRLHAASKAGDLGGFMDAVAAIRTASRSWDPAHLAAIWAE